MHRRLRHSPLMSIAKRSHSHENSSSPLTQPCENSGPCSMLQTLDNKPHSCSGLTRGYKPEWLRREPMVHAALRCVAGREHLSHPLSANPLIRKPQKEVIRFFAVVYPPPPGRPHTRRVLKGGGDGLDECGGMECEKASAHPRHAGRHGGAGRDPNLPLVGRLKRRRRQPSPAACTAQSCVSCGRWNRPPAG